MENASKALLMAGGILIAIIIIALLAKTFSNIGEFQMSKLSEEEQQKLIAFNEQYTKYLNQYVYGTDVITLLNKEKITGVKVNFKEGSEIPGEGYSQEFEYIDGGGYVRGEYATDTKYYKCIDIEFDNNTGKVSSITFDQIKVGP